MIKAAFFDIDGTLLHKTTDHLIPMSAKHALADLHANGVKVIICSGRPVVQLPPCIFSGFPGLDDGFDAYITITGSFCFDKHEVYDIQCLDPEVVQRVYAEVKAGKFDCLAMDDMGVWSNQKSAKVLELENFVASEYPVADFDELLNKTIFQMCPIITPDKDAYLQELVGDNMVMRWCDLFCDIVPATSSKPHGIQATLDRYGIDRSETIAFGDGGNDVEMLKFCEIGVAMGNAVDEAKQAADYVTDDVDKDGIAKALVHFGLIDEVRP